MTPQEYCQNKAAKSGSSFYYSFIFLPREKREAITALYAFCREVDDIADECHDVAVARTKLAWWRQEIHKTFLNAPSHPVSHVLAGLIQEYQFSENDFQTILDGMEMDLGQNCYADFSTLQVYCHRVAGVVGQLAARIFGYKDAQVLSYAEDLGTALQLTNIIRDVGEDARRGRIYLPQEDLQKFAVPPEDIFAGRDTPAFLRLMAFQIERAKHYYSSALSKLPTAERKTQRTGLIMATIYKTLLVEIAREPGLVLTRRISLTPVRKFWLAWKTWVWA